jgi:two-component system OmpR family response regulator
VSASATVIIAREDLSIPGAAEDGEPAASRSDAVKARFFDLVNSSRPDVIVLDLSRAAVSGSDAILTVKQRTQTPILVVCDPAQARLDQYRVAGATDCVPAPVDIIALHQAIQRVLRGEGRSKAPLTSLPADLGFAGLHFYSERDRLQGADGATIALTRSEGRLLAYFLSKPWNLCTRAEIGELLYGPEHNVGDRALDMVVNRLRKKLGLVGGADAEQLITTEFGRGYWLGADVATLPRDAVSLPPGQAADFHAAA